ncbi:glycoside hydrolase family 65 protein [Enterobacter cloacae complex sp. 2024EL-00215]|uniref:glycoside hydrolase family 65 protein n=1 Tax=unclassified Enterobacter cloacae complex TaxID=2757714 RepID=UPI0037500AE4
MRIYINELDASSLEKAESIFFNGNGFIGVRGGLEENHYTSYRANKQTYINGFYETKNIHYPERCYGFPETGETMIGVVDGQMAVIEIGGERFTIFEGNLEEHTRYLDMSAGSTVRELIWCSPKGRRTRITITRLASLVKKDLFAIHYRFNRLNHDEEIVLSHEFRFTNNATIDLNDPRVSHDVQNVMIDNIDFAQQHIAFSTCKSGLSAMLRWHLSLPANRVQQYEDRFVITTPVTGDVFTKILSYEYHQVKFSGFDITFDELAALQQAWLTEYWENAKITVKSELRIEESVNFGLWSLLCSLGTDGNTSISAKGLSGNGYEGHYFWDAEMYIFPAFLHTSPSLAKQMLQFRINTLEAAREIRKSLGYKRGASYPWRTISGIESSSFFEAGTAQLHISTDIAYAFIRYFQFTGDIEFFFNGGYEVLLETARFFCDVGYERDGAFHIDKVTGPDEYSVLVNDNYYTNSMVQFHFKWVVQLSEILAASDHGRWNNIQERLGLIDEELGQLQYYSSIMCLLTDSHKNIVMQDRDFINKDRWPFYDENKYPLLLHYHPLTIYRYQISKQADAVLALMLFPGVTTTECRMNSVNYYDEVTTHDSSLSYSIFSIVYSQLGMQEKAMDYFLKNVRCDLDNLHGNTQDGLHTAAMGGTYMNILYGFCGLSIDETLSLNPKLPDQIDEISFKIYFKGDWYAINVNHHGFKLKLVD